MVELETNQRLSEFREELELLLSRDFDFERTKTYIRNAPPRVPGYTAFVEAIPLLSTVKDLENREEKDIIFEFMFHLFKNIKSRDEGTAALWGSSIVSEYENGPLDCRFFDTSERMRKLIHRLKESRDMNMNDAFAFVFIMNPYCSMYVALKEILFNPQWKYFFTFRKYIGSFKFLTEKVAKIDTSVGVETFKFAIKELAEEFKDNIYATDGLAELFFLSTLGKYPLLSTKEVFKIACNYIIEGCSSYFATIDECFNNQQEMFVWDTSSDEYDNPYNFVPVLLNRFGKQESRANNNKIVKWLEYLVQQLRDQDISLKFTTAMRVTGGPENWAFRIAAFHILGLSETKFEVPKSIYITISDAEKQNYVCIFDEEETSFEKYLDHFFELILIGRIAPDELINGVASTYKFQDHFLELIPKVAYKKIKEVEKYYGIIISQLFTNNLGNLYCALSYKSKADMAIYEAFAGISIKDTLDLKKILALSDILLEHLKNYQVIHHKKLAFSDIEQDNLAMLLLEGFEFEVYNRIGSYKQTMIDSNYKRQLHHYNRNNYNPLDNSFNEIKSSMTYLSCIHFGNRLMEAAIRIHNNGYGMNQRLQGIMFKLDDFLRKNEVITNSLRDKVNSYQ